MNEDKSQQVLNEFEHMAVRLKSIQLKMQCDEETASRAYLWAVVKQISEKMKCDLPFKDERLESISRSIHGMVDAEKFLRHPDLFDSVYEKSVPKNFRKKTGQFLTPQKIAEFMVRLGMCHNPKRILDPAIGTGIFLSEILKSKEKSADFYGLDIDPLMLNITYIRGKIIDRKSNQTLIKQNYLTFSSKEKFDFVVCNPPYMKFHYYDRNLISKIERESGRQLSKLTNIYSLFFIHTGELLKEDGILVFITPSEFLYTGYGQELKTFFLDGFTIEAIILADLDTVVFNDALTSAAITILRKKRPDNTHRVKLISVKGWHENDGVYNAFYNLIASNDVTIREVVQSELNPSKKWLSLFNGDVAGNYKGLVPLKKIARVKRGIATGHNEFFTLTSSEVEKWGINPYFLRFAVSKAKHCPNYSFSAKDLEKLRLANERVYLLYCFDAPDENLKAYIDYGKKLNVHKRFLTSKRSPWYSMEKREMAPVLATVFSRERMRFILNDADVLNLASFHGIYPAFRDRKQVKAFLAYLNSHFCSNQMTLQKRTYGGGLDKFEPRDLMEILVLDVTSLNENIVHELADLFDKLCLTKTESEEREVKIKIDELVVRSLSQDAISQRQKTESAV